MLRGCCGDVAGMLRQAAGTVSEAKGKALVNEQPYFARHPAVGYDEYERCRVGSDGEQILRATTTRERTRFDPRAERRDR